MGGMKKADDWSANAKGKIWAQNIITGWYKEQKKKGGDELLEGGGEIIAAMETMCLSLENDNIKVEPPVGRAIWSYVAMLKEYPVNWDALIL